MTKRAKIHKPAPQKTDEAKEVEPKEISAEKLKEETDALLDEIDSLLEEQAEEFVRNYVQKGGQ